MDIPAKMKTYCPFCKKTTVHKVKKPKRGRVRNTTEGQRKHVEKGKGYTSKIAGKVTVYKQAKRTTVMLVCEECGKKHPKTVGARTRKVAEIKK
jgi:large subunit ribosomal protein L44e